MDASADISRPLGESVREGLAKSLVSLGILARVLVPSYLVVDLLRQTPVIPWIADALAPAMGLLGLPGEAAVPLVAGFTVNLYAALGAMAPLGLAPRQVTILGLVLGIAHALLLETAVIRQVCRHWLALAAARLVLGLSAGALLHLVLP